MKIGSHDHIGTQKEEQTISCLQVTFTIACVHYKVRDSLGEFPLLQAYSPLHCGCRDVQLHEITK